MDHTGGSFRAFELAGWEDPEVVSRYQEHLSHVTRQSIEALLDEARAIHAGGGNGSIVGRNAFQRPKDEALKLLASMIEVYKTKV